MNYGHGGDVYGENKIDLDFSVNTNPFGMPERVKQAVVSQSDGWNRYPDSRCRELKKELSLYFNQHFEGDSSFAPKDFICGNGAADLLYTLIFALRPKKALLFVPSFTEYEEALKAGGCDVEKIYGEEETAFSVEPVILKMMECREDTDMIILGNPNNPTGEVLQADQLLKLAEYCCEKNITLVVDECFNWFLKEAERYSLAPYLECYPNVFILNAFTKIFAMAGLRLGYGICKNTEILELMEGCRQPWSVSAPAVSAGIQALKEQTFVMDTIDFIESERRNLERGLENLGFQVWPSSVNYILFKGEKKNLPELLKKSGILIRSCGNFDGLGDHYYRTAVRLRSENEKLLLALETVLMSKTVCDIKEK